MDQIIKKFEHLTYFSKAQVYNKIKSLIHMKSYVDYQPNKLTFYISDRCTLRCEMCLQHSKNEINTEYLRYRHESLQDMSFETFKKILDRFDRSTNVSLAGVGEPLLNNNFFKMVNYAHLNNKLVSTITNGTVLRGKLDMLIDSPLDQISISLNAYNSHDYANIMGCKPKLFDIVVENISNLVRIKKIAKKNITLRVSYICTKLNYKNIPNMIEFASSIGIDEIDFLNLIPTGCHRFTKNECLYDNDLDVIDLIKGLPSYNANLKINKPKLIKRIIKKRSCRWYFENLSVDANGNVGSCGAIIAPRSSFGNALNDVDVWNNNHFVNMRKMFLDKSCPLKGCCKYCVNIS